jgi:hypothetical protein
MARRSSLRVSSARFEEIVGSLYAKRAEGNV